MSDEIQIDKGVPVPREGGREARYPFGKMAVGDSFFSERHQAPNAATQYAKQHKSEGVKFTCRKVTENGVKGVRVWRIA